MSTINTSVLVTIGKQSRPLYMATYRYTLKRPWHRESQTKHTPTQLVTPPQARQEPVTQSTRRSLVLNCFHVTGAIPRCHRSYSDVTHILSQVRLQVLKMASMKRAFWDTAPCGLVNKHLHYLVYTRPKWNNNLKAIREMLPRAFLSSLVTHKFHVTYKNRAINSST